MNRIKQTVNDNPEENVNPIINKKRALQVSLRDALEVEPLFYGSNSPLSHFIKGCYEVKAILPTPADQENSALLLITKLSGEARKCILGSTYNNIEELINKRAFLCLRALAPSKSRRPRALCSARWRAPR